MRRAVLWGLFSFLCVGLTGQTCLEERGVEVVVGANVYATFEARGSDNVFNDTETVDVIESADIRQVLEDNGFENLVVGRVSSAFFRIVKPDAGAPDRTVSGAVSVDGQTLVQFTQVAVNAPGVADWRPVPLEAAGVAYINQRLEDYFEAVFQGTPPSGVPLVFRIDGTSTPADVPTDFDWEVRVKLTLVGRTYIEVPDPL